MNLYSNQINCVTDMGMQNIRRLINMVCGPILRVLIISLMAIKLRIMAYPL